MLVFYLFSVNRFLPSHGLVVTRKKTTAHLLILTDKELILISDVKSEFYDGARYGGAWQYIPIGNLVNLTITVQEDKSLLLTIKLIRNICIKRLFINEKEGELEKLRKNVKNALDRANETVRCCYATIIMVKKKC